MPGRVWIRVDNPRKLPDLVFEFPRDEELNAAVKRLPGRWFDWRRKHWRVPADPRIAKSVEVVLARFPELEPGPEVRSWLSDADRWRALVSVTARDGAGAFVLRTLSGDAPALDGAQPFGEHQLVIPFGAPAAGRIAQLEGVQLDDLARACARELEAGRTPAPAALELETATTASRS